MRYVSTRAANSDATPGRRFCEILLEGLAPDGGLYLPVKYPTVDDATLAIWRSIYQDQGYAELAFVILSLYIDDIPADDLRALCHKTYTPAVFGTREIVPLRQLEPGLWIEALSNGPTLAFKDMAMQLLGNLFEYELARRGEELNILGATSGDTGSAAEYAMRGKKGIRVFMTSPAGRMSPFQQAQMFSLMDENIFNIAIEGVFDDCQDLVKAVSADLEFKRRYKIGTVNSINWARLLAQVVYYFAGYFQATSSNTQKVSFAVPSGNFGNVCAGHVARMMGLPIHQLMVATNENDVLDEFFRTGLYRVRSTADTLETTSPSMDISKASNFERFVFDLLDRDGTQVKALFADALNASGQFDLAAHPAFKLAAARYGFVSGRSTHANRIATMQDTWQRFACMIDPHTADGLKVAREQAVEGVQTIVLETALPIKFAATVQEALKREPERPAALEGIEALPKRVQQMSADLEALKALIARACDAWKSTMIALDDAVARLLQRAPVIHDAEQVALLEADGRVLAQDCIAPLAVPGHDNSAMDGYAIRCADVPTARIVLPVSQRIPAGSVPVALEPGTMARIFTGAPIPAGADAVVMQELCAYEGVDALQRTLVRCDGVPTPGQCIRRTGEDIQQGSVLLKQGTRLNPAMLGLAASVGLAQLSVVRRPRVALFATGNELVLPGTVAPHALPAGHIFNSNRFFLHRLLERLGCDVTDCGQVDDTLAATQEALARAAQGHDVILTTGGVSVGEEDHVRTAVQSLGALNLWQIAIKPGKPFAHGQIGDAQVMGLPGNPVSSFITFLLLVRPFLLRIQGVQDVDLPRLALRADFARSQPDRRREFLRGRRNHHGAVELFPNQGSGVLTSMAWADGLVDVAPGQTIAKGDTVSFISFVDALA